jgi:hypothetical protein
MEDGHLKNVLIEDTGECLQLYTEARLGESYAAVEAFRKGLLWVIPESAISVLAWDELEYLVCGSKNIDVDRLKKNTEYDDDISPSDPHIVNFWEILESFSEKDKSSFLRFVWARPTLQSPVLGNAVLRLILGVGTYMFFLAHLSPDRFYNIPSYSGEC